MACFMALSGLHCMPPNKEAMNEELEKILELRCSGYFPEAIVQHHENQSG
jgi:hypothetical protein